MLITSAEEEKTQELSSEAAMDLSSALTSNDTLSDSGGPPAETSHLIPEVTDLPVSVNEASVSPPVSASSLLAESPEPPAEPTVPAEEPPPPPSSVDLLQPAAVTEVTAEDSDSLAQAIEEATGPAEVSTDPLSTDPAQHSSHESDQEAPEDLQ